MKVSRAALCYQDQHGYNVAQTERVESFFKGGTPLINLEHKAELLNENKVSNQLRKSISGTRSRLPVGLARLEVESQDCQMRHVNLLQYTTGCMSAVFI